MKPRQNPLLRAILITVLIGAVSWWVPPIHRAAAAVDREAFEEGIALLSGNDFSQKTAAVARLAASGDPRVEPVLKALLAGNLYHLKSSDTLVIATGQGDGYAVRAALSDESLGVLKKRKLKKIPINNNIRVRLKAVLSRLRLSSPDPGVPIAALHKMLGTVSPDAETSLDTLLQTEPHAAVRQALQSVIAMSILRSGPAADPATQIEALKQLTGNLHPAVHNELVRVIASAADTQVRQTAQEVLDGIDARLGFIHFFETFFFGLSLGSVLVLAATGLAITFGVIGVINMAHGELIMLGAYTTYVLQQLLPDDTGMALLLSVPAAFAVSGLAGIAIERSVIRFLYGRPLETLLATFGISLMLQQAVRSIFSPLNRSVASPDWMSGAIQINAALSLTTNRVVILMFAIAVFAGLALLLKKSALGLQVRAVSQNRAMARAMGVRAARVDALTFGLGSGIAGIAGVALSQLTNVGPNLGQAYIVDSFMVVVFGGVGNLWGTLLGGLTLGVINKFMEPWTGAVMAKIAILAIIILFIQKRPQGLFPQKGRAAAG